MGMVPIACGFGSGSRTVAVCDRRRNCSWIVHGLGAATLAAAGRAWRRGDEIGRGSTKMWAGLDPFFLLSCRPVFFLFLLYSDVIPWSTCRLVWRIEGGVGSDMGWVLR
ncbi:hypothetical protein M0R45_016884 [Rubus argutus]|uniref:Uncharacterized protein n=1 Tax=Rubus argutus TaxID=59490 RepID=A0AAW1XWM9_RUBAR